MKIKDIIKKKKVKIPIIVVVGILVGLFSADYFLFIHQLPVAGEEFVLSDIITNSCLN